MKNLNMIGILINLINTTYVYQYDVDTLCYENICKEYYKLKIQDEIEKELETYNIFKKWGIRGKFLKHEDEMFDFKEKIKLVLLACDNLCFEVNNFYKNPFNLQKKDMFIVKCIKIIQSAFIFPMISSKGVNKIIYSMINTGVFKCYVMIDDYSKENRERLTKICSDGQNDFHVVQEKYIV
ncbi:uncharacterized protein VNE69_09097 [Vairimorpha necatrix]|uniref:Uncharacterized protein n=1 Tax=Vairimorpha necatrix TaxID=6039 RepID=A0AAX4JEY3_9MICR